MIRQMARHRCSGDPDEGATAVEYVMLVSLIAVIIISSVTLLGGSIDAMVGDIADHLGGGTATR
jgi:pilus assembly protein Flp/PilA